MPSTVAPEIKLWQLHTHDADQRVNRNPHGVLVDHNFFFQALGAGSGDVLLPEHFQQAAAHDADQLGHAARAQDQGRPEQVVEQYP